MLLVDRHSTLVDRHSTGLTPVTKNTYVTGAANAARECTAPVLKHERQSPATVAPIATAASVAQRDALTPDSSPTNSRVRERSTTPTQEKIKIDTIRKWMDETDTQEDYRLYSSVEPVLNTPAGIFNDENFDAYNTEINKSNSQELDSDEINMFLDTTPEERDQTLFGGGFPLYKAPIVVSSQKNNTLFSIEHLFIMSSSEDEDNRLFGSGFPLETIRISPFPQSISYFNENAGLLFSSVK